MSTPCFWVEPTGEAEVSLRRYSRSDGGPCTKVPPGWTIPRPYHDASTRIGRQPVALTSEGYVDSIDGSVGHDDERWPVACACGYAFIEDDRWQVKQEPIYRGSNGREWGHRNLPPGAMLNAHWQPDAWKGSDGMAVTVVLPEGPYVEGVTDTRGWWWNVDGPSNDGAGNLNAHAWTRTGDPKAVPPTVSATPSINAVGRYHGFLTNGVLTDNIG